MNSEIGLTIKNIRKSKGLTLSQFSQATGFSVGYLSNLENNNTSPTIAHLHKLCNFLGITLNDLFSTENSFSHSPIIRTQNRKYIYVLDEGLHYEAITEGNTYLKGSAMIMSSNEVYQFATHNHDEIGIVMQGTMDITIDELTYSVSVGDTIYIKANSFHQAKKTSNEDCISYWIKSMPFIGVTL